MSTVLYNRLQVGCVPVVPAGQLVHTTSLVFRTTAQVAPAGQGHG